MTSIRRAVPDDAPALAAIGRATFAGAFGDLYWPKDLEAFSAAAYDLDRMRGELEDARIAVWLAQADGEVVGYAVAGPCELPHPEVTGACGELKRVYVLRGLQGGGTGSRLISEALGWLEREGPRRLWIGVWSGNRGARRLYERLGFEKVGEYYFHVGEALDREFILRRG
jgi:diamine N-acetyltransferase